MNAKRLLMRSIGAAAVAALIGAPLTASAQTARQRRAAGVASFPTGAERPTSEVQLSIGQGELITLPANVASVWTSNPGVADVYVNNPRQIHLFGKEFGEATVFATSASGQVVYATNVRVAQNLTSLDRMIKAAMPDADVSITTVGQIAVLNGTVKSPQDSEQAQRLVTSLLNPGVNLSDPNAQLKMGVINRLRTATPLQVNLQVRFAEVSRSFIKDFGVNTVTRDQTSGFNFGLIQGRPDFGKITTPDLSKLPVLDASSRFGFPAGTISLPYDPVRGDFVYPGTGSAYSFTKGSTNGTIGLAGKLLGLDILSALDLGETVGQVSTLTNPNLTAISGETGSFLVGGEIPILVNNGLSGTSVEYKPYGVSLTYTPTVLADGRISLRVKPEVSQLDSGSGVNVGGSVIPALTTRRAETTVELGSGESMVIGGLLSNSHNNQFTKTPGVGDLPVLGALFRSNSFRRNETELVIVITPYLVKPVNANDIVLPTDGYKAPNDFNRLLLGQLDSGHGKGGDRPKPMMAPNTGGQPAVGAMSPAPVTPAPAPAAPQPQTQSRKAKKGGASATPGFGL